jgi:hypothetical protein
MNAWVGPILPWLATTYRLQWERSMDLAPDHRRKLLNCASRAARRAVRVSRRFKPDLPHALRESGLIAAMQGSIRKTRKCLDESLEVADRQGALFEHAQSLLARGQLGEQYAWPEAEQDLKTAQQGLLAIAADFVLATAKS